ncbi:MAG: polymerase alpha subunit [Clostridiales bacterium]|nr:polymerase alpha subunit [Clostridiales bacterium]
MDKGFFEVFEGMKVDQDLTNLFGQVVVSNVVVNKHDMRLSAHIISKRILHYKDINLMEKAMEEQLFGKLGLTVRICERYELSQQYSAEKLFEIYYDSILAELEAISAVEYTMLKNAKYEITGEILTFTIGNSFLHDTKSDSVNRFITTIFRERFDIPIIVRCVNTEEANKYSAKNMKKLEQEVAKVMAELGDKNMDENGEFIESSKDANSKDSNKINMRKKLQFQRIRTLYMVRILKERQLI